MDDDMEVEQEIVVIPVKDAELFEAYSTSHGVTTIHLNNNSKPSEAVVCEICSLKVTSMAALERHQKAKHQNISFTCAECGISKDSRRKLTDHLITHKTFICPNCDKVMKQGRYKGIRTKASLDMWNTKKWGVNPSTMLKKKRMIRRKKYRYFEC